MQKPNIINILMVFLVAVIALGSCQTQEPNPSLESYSGSDISLNILKYLEVDVKETRAIAPNFPNPAKWMNGEETSEYTDVFKKWTEDHFDEFQKFANQDKIRAKSFAWKPAGFESPYINRTYYSPFSQAAAVIEPERLKEIAPHFPLEKDAKSKDAYEIMLKQWQNEYVQEYEDWLNAPEIMALKHKDARNPVSLGIQEKLPEFMSRTNIVAERPIQLESESDNDYALRLQNWYFVFHEDEYVSLYGDFPELPSDFNLERYRKGLQKPQEIAK